MDENTLGEWSDGNDDWIWDIDESTLPNWSDPEADDIIRNMNLDENTLGEWSDGNDDWIWDVDESDLRSDPETDDSIQSDPGLMILYKQVAGRNVKATSRCYRKRTFTKKRA